GMTTALLGVVEQIPQRTRELVELLSLAAPDEETRRTLEEAEFYFAGIHSMCAHDLGRLRTLLAPYSAPDAPPPSPAQRNFLCEVAADLKGKYASALMGATASIVAEGSWTGVEVEPVLFPEKAEEFRRNAALARALRRTLDGIGELQAAVPFGELLERWGSGARVDPYALADLATFRGVLGRLLKRDLRRGFYSGDYHQIQRREAALATRAAALEATHHRTWAEPADAPGAAEAYAQLGGLTLEVAALLDVAVLEQLVGARAVKDLRLAAAESSAHGQGRGRRSHLEPRLEPLVPLLAGEDLQTFLALLLGSVLKRASLAGHEGAAELQPGGSAVANVEPPRSRPRRETTAPQKEPPPGSKPLMDRVASGPREQRRESASAGESLPPIEDALAAAGDVTPPPRAANRR